MACRWSTLSPRQPPGPTSDSPSGQPGTAQLQQELAAQLELANQERAALFAEQAKAREERAQLARQIKEHYRPQQALTWGLG